MIYLDHAATSWPKPPGVMAAMSEFLERAGGNPGRSGHLLSIEGGRIVFEARRTLARLFNAADPKRVIFTTNATHAVNIVLRGLLEPGDAVLTTGMEHNAVMRPLTELSRSGVAVTVAPCDLNGELDRSVFASALESRPKLVVLNHASNVNGAVCPVAELASTAHKHGAMVLVDAAQSAGILEIDVGRMGIDFLAFTGHKGLQGPPGTGGLVFGPQVDPLCVEPLVRGGTGSRSDSTEQPDFLPDRFESGTPNGVGIAGLLAGVRWVVQKRLDQIEAHHRDLLDHLISGLRAIGGVTVYTPPGAGERASVVSLTVSGKTVSEVGQSLDERFGICCRVGLHCAPTAHNTLGTLPRGTVRFALGPGNTHEEIDLALAAVREIAGE